MDRYCGLSGRWDSSGGCEECDSSLELPLSIGLPFSGSLDFSLELPSSPSYKKNASQIHVYKQKTGAMHNDNSYNGTFHTTTV